MYEIVLVSLIVMITFYISSKKLINPIETITSDINDYKFGKRPYKRKLPNKMEKIQNTFVDLVDALEQEKEYQNQIIASISHDIKTPLTTVIGYADRLKNNKLTKEKKELYIEKIYNKALLIKGILEEFDDYQSCNIKETMKFKKVKIKDLCNNIKNDFEIDLQDKNIILNVTPYNYEDVVLIDEIKIRRVFGNIITNSVNNFKGKKGNIVIETIKKENSAVFSIKDNGGGIKNEGDLKKIFEPLYTTDPSRKISGLGLSICKQIITAHDGRIYAKNNEMDGLTVVFILPIIKP